MKTEHERFFETTNPTLVQRIQEAVALPSREAAKFPPVMEGDGAVTIHCGGEEEVWQSRYLAFHYYMTGATECEGSESDRYWQIVSGLFMGASIPSDDIPVRRTA